MRHNEINKKVNEGGLASLADMAERDHEVQMARADLYKIAKYAIKLHEMLKTVSESEGIEGWQQSKITKAADYIGSVYHAMDYDMKFAEQQVESAKKSSYKDGLTAMLERKTSNFDNTKRDFAPTARDVKNKVAKASAQRNQIGGSDYKPQVDTMVSTGQGVKDKEAKLDRMAQNTAKSAGMNAGNVEKDLNKQFQANVKAAGPKFKDKFRKKTESKDELCKECGKPSYTTLDEEKQKGVDGKVCWKGYKRMGTKKKGGKTVDNCVKM